MIKIGIVEDERLLLDDLVNNVDWEAWGIEVSFAERNGAKALARLPREYADIVLTDISMPVMNGIRMSEEIQKRYPDVQFIFLTSYNDAEYARSAIELNAVAYLSKPVHLPQLHKAVKEAMCRLDLITSARYGMQLKREEQLIHLLSDENSPEARESYPGLWQLFSLQIANFPSIVRNRSSAEMKWLATEVRDRLRYFFSCRCDNFCAAYLSNGEFIVAADPSYDFSAMTDADRNELADSVGESIGFDFFFASQNPLITAGEFAAQYRRLTEKRRESFYQYRPSAPSGESNADPQEALNRAISAIGLPDEDVLSALDSWFLSVRARRTARKVIIADCYRICEALLNTLRDSTESAGAGGFDRQETLSMLEEQPSLDALKCCIISLREGLKTVSPDLQRAGMDTVSRIKRHIGEHYQEAISAETLTRDFYLASNAIRSLFKQQTGKTIHEYLTLVRLEQARKLLADPDLRIKEIAARTGYRNVSYFCKVFSDMFGTTPMNYRMQLPGKNGAFAYENDKCTDSP